MHGDLIARLRWLAEHDRAALVAVLATVEAAALREALGGRVQDPSDAE